MNKILLVIQREYSTRVRKASFWVLTLVVPILLAIVYAIPIMLATKPIERANILVADETGLFTGQFRSERNVVFHDAGSLTYAQRQLKEVDSLDAIVYIPARTSSLPSTAYLYYRSDAPSVAIQNIVDAQLQELLRNAILLDVHDISPDDYEMLTKVHIDLRTQDIETGRDGFLEVKSIVGALLALLIFVAVFMFGSQVMRGVMEEKGSRIIEVIVSSVKPFQLMMGKVVGIGLVGLTQFGLWVLLSGVAVGALRVGNADLFEQATRNERITQVATKGSEATAQYQAMQREAEQYDAGLGIDKNVEQLLQGLTSINYGLLLGLFLIYFVVGYLLYASLFAAVGSLVDNETDSQQFTLPITIPLLLSILLLPAVMQEPSGSLAVWLSLIPFTSPVAMMFRIPFGVPVWQVTASLALLLATFPCCIWAAAKIYRTAILRYGRKTTWRDLLTFLRGK